MSKETALLIVEGSIIVVKHAGGLLVGTTCFEVEEGDLPSHESTRYLSQARGKLCVSIDYCMCNLGMCLRECLKRHGCHATCARAAGYHVLYLDASER